MTAFDQEEAELVRRLCSGDATAFEVLVSRHHVSMVRLARSFVATDAAAEDMAQEAWLAALHGIERFEGRSAVKTWLFRILVNRAKSGGTRDSRCLPFSSVSSTAENMSDPDRLLRRDHQRSAGWDQRAAPSRRSETPESALVDGETRQQLEQALNTLPPTQRSVVALRDVSGYSASEVCDILGLTEANQRVILHRGRTRMRQRLAAALRPELLASA